MKNIILGFALIATGVACKTSNANVSDPSFASAPEASCTACGVDSDCEGCPDMASSCSAEGECSDEAKVCPYSGEVIEN